MTKQEAIEQFKDYENSGWSKSITPSSEALGMAIEALEQQEDMIKVVRCNDCMKYGHICYGIINNGYCSDGERGEK